MINEYENTLRRLIIQVIGGDDSSPYKITDDRRAKWIDKRETEAKRNNGVLFEDGLLYYSDFFDLKTIISNNWNQFLPILKDKKRFEIFFSEMENYRNTISHGRNLILGQEYLLKGILSDLKTLITVFHNKNEMKEDFFIEIIKVTDNLGNVWEPGLRGNTPVLRVGDEYQLIVEANDPRSRKIEYELNSIKSDFKVVSNSNRFSFTIEKKLIGPHTILLI